MSTLTVTSPPTSLSADQQLGRITFIEPDTSCDPWDCDYVAIPRPLTLTYHELPLHDLRPEIFSSSSPYGLNRSGFAAVKHRSALHSAPYSKESFLDEDIVKQVYIPETEKLAKNVTGAKRIYIVRPPSLSPNCSPPQTEALYLPKLSNTDKRRNTSPPGLPTHENRRRKSRQPTHGARALRSKIRSHDHGLDQTICRGQ